MKPIIKYITILILIPFSCTIQEKSKKNRYFSYQLDDEEIIYDNSMSVIIFSNNGIPDNNSGIGLYFFDWRESFGGTNVSLDFADFPIKEQILYWNNGIMENEHLAQASYQYKDVFDVSNTTTGWLKMYDVTDSTASVDVHISFDKNYLPMDSKTLIIKGSFKDISIVKHYR